MDSWDQGTVFVLLSPSCKCSLYNSLLFSYKFNEEEAKKRKEAEKIQRRQYGEEVSDDEEEAEAKRAEAEASAAAAMEDEGDDFVEAAMAELSGAKRAALSAAASSAGSAAGVAADSASAPATGPSAAVLAALEAAKAHGLSAAVLLLHLPDYLFPKLKWHRSIL